MGVLTDSKYFLQESIKRPGALRRYAERHDAITRDGLIDFEKLKKLYPHMTLLQKQEYNLYAHVLRQVKK